MVRKTCGIAALTAIAVCLGACLTNVPQNKRSGKDSKFRGAKRIRVEDGEGRSRRDIVTYPGGDRVDWKVFEIPAGGRGTLTVKLKFKPPRPGLDVAMRIYNQFFERVGQAKPSPGTGKVSKTVKISGAEAGMKYFVQVYAPRRIDAGRYRVLVRFKEAKAIEVAPQVAVADLPDPPKLPAIPEVVEPPPPTPCPNDPSKMTPNCGPAVVEPPPVEIKKVEARIVGHQVAASGGVIITVDKGKGVGVDKGWKGRVVNSSGSTVDGGEFTVTKVTSGESVGKVQLSIDQVKANRRVVMTSQ